MRTQAMISIALCSIHPCSLWTVLQVSLNKDPGRVAFFVMLSMCVFQLMVVWMVTLKH